jgi:hypothetical protein
MSKKKPNQNSSEHYHKGSCVEFFLSKGIPSRNTTHEHLGETSLIFVQTPKKVTDKTQDQLMDANWEDLNLMEKVLRSELESNPDMSLEKAIEFSEMLPL